MTPDESVTTALHLLRGGDAEAARFLWTRYFPRMVEKARGHLAGLNRAAADEEDVAQLAFQNFCEAVQAGRIPDLADRHDLWRSLMVLTAGKAVEQRRHQTREKRGGGAVAAEAGFLEELAGREPDPAFTALVAEQCGRLLRILDDPLLQQIAVRKMEGFTNEEIADRIRLSPRTVRRQLAMIRKTWERETHAAGEVPE